jgi:hypothetical protein
MMLPAPQLVGELIFGKKAVFLGKQTVFEARLASAFLEVAKENLNLNGVNHD